MRVITTVRQPHSRALLDAMERELYNRYSFDGGTVAASIIKIASDINISKQEKRRRIGKRYHTALHFCINYLDGRIPAVAERTAFGRHRGVYHLTS